MVRNLKSVASWIDASKKEIAKGELPTQPVYEVTNNEFRGILARIAAKHTTWQEQRNSIVLIALQAKKAIASWLGRSDTDDESSSSDGPAEEFDDGSSDTDDE
jgi:hypothetical protein